MFQLSKITQASLVKRFLFGSLVILPLFIIASGTILLNTYQHSRFTAEEETLQAQMYLLLSLAEFENNQLALPEAFIEPRLNQIHSGLYAMIYDNKKRELWRSPSSQLLTLQEQLNQKTFIRNQRFFSNTSINQGITLNTLTYDTEWLSDNNTVNNFRFVIATDAELINNEIKSFRNRLWQWLGFMGLGLLAAQLFIMRWGLRPLRKLSKELLLLKNQSIQQLSQQYPAEVQPVVNNLNEILEQEKQQRERYRNTMADLAHSVKTPLAVIRSQLDLSTENIANNTNNINTANTQTINEHIDRIDQIIGHQLQRAVIRSNKHSLPIQESTNIFNTINRLTNTLNKVYKDKAVDVKNLCEQNELFYGNESDLLEVLGNILDNAYKYGFSAVVITTKTCAEQLSLKISDDGEGIPHIHRQNILQRGERADTMISPSTSGQGLGLSVAAEIISAYGGEIYMTNNEEPPHLSGACFTITFKQ